MHNETETKTDLPSCLLPYEYTIIIQYGVEYFIASAPDLEGCIVRGSTQLEALRNIQHAIIQYLENFPERALLHA